MKIEIAVRQELLSKRKVDLKCHSIIFKLVVTVCAFFVLIECINIYIVRICCRIFVFNTSCLLYFKYSLH